MVKKTKMKHIRNRRNRFQRSFLMRTTPLRGEVANRHIQQRTFRRIAPVASCEVDFILAHALRFVNFCRVSRASPPWNFLFYAPPGAAAKTRANSFFFILSSSFVCVFLVFPCFPVGSP